jgi:glycosyltransferase involved in cell wall biosynthesis
MAQAMSEPDNTGNDVVGLTRRVAVGTGRRPKPASTVTEPAKESGERRSPSETAGAAETSRFEVSGGSMSRLWRRVVIMAWCARHFRTILRRAIAGVYTAEQARAGVNELQSRTHALEEVSQRLERVTADLSIQAEAIAYQQTAFQHDVRFQQRWLMPLALPTGRSSLLRRLRLPTVGVISTWNSRCGIASYAESLLVGIDNTRLRVFANKVAEVVREDESFVSRCWIAGWDDPLDELVEEVLAADVDVVTLQFNFGFFRPAALQRLLDRLHGEGILVFMTLHATMDVNIPGMTARLGDIRASLARVCRLLVHSVHDLDRLKAIGLVENVALFPHGLPQPFSGDRGAVRRSLGLEKKRVVASFGFLLPNKGLPELIRAFALLRTRLPDTHLLMLNSVYPIAASEQELDVCMEEIRRLSVQDSVTLVTDFLAEETAMARLAASDIVVYPYQHTQESASGAVRIGIASGTAVAVTPLRIFDDVAAVSHRLPGTAPAAIAEGLATLLSDRARLNVAAKQRQAWAAAHEWSTLSARLDSLICDQLDARIAVYARRRGHWPGSPDQNRLSAFS